MVVVAEVVAVVVEVVAMTDAGVGRVEVRWVVGAVGG